MLAKCYSGALSGVDARTVEIEVFSSIGTSQFAIVGLPDAAVKEAKALEKKRKNTLRMVLSAQKDAARDQKRLDRYIRKYEKRKARRDARKKDTLEEIQ